MFDRDRHLLGGYGIVGGQIPLATGAAFAIACKTGPAPGAPAVMCLLGDATTNIGAFLTHLRELIEEPPDIVL